MTLYDYQQTEVRIVGAPIVIKDMAIALIVNRFFQHPSSGEVGHTYKLLTIDKIGCFCGYKLVHNGSYYTAKPDIKNKEIIDIQHILYKTIAQQNNGILHSAFSRGLINGIDYIFTLSYKNDSGSESFFHANVRQFIIFDEANEEGLPHNKLILQLPFHQQTVQIFHNLNNSVDSFFIGLELSLRLSAQSL